MEQDHGVIWVPVSHARGWVVHSSTRMYQNGYRVVGHLRLPGDARPPVYETTVENREGDRYNLRFEWDLAKRRQHGPSHYPWPGEEWVPMFPDRTPVATTARSPEHARERFAEMRREQGPDPVPEPVHPAVERANRLGITWSEVGTAGDGGTVYVGPSRPAPDPEPDRVGGIVSDISPGLKSLVSDAIRAISENGEMFGFDLAPMAVLNGHSINAASYTLVVSIYVGEGDSLIACRTLDPWVRLPRKNEIEDAVRDAVDELRRRKSRYTIR